MRKTQLGCVAWWASHASGDSMKELVDIIAAWQSQHIDVRVGCTIPGHESFDIEQESTVAIYSFKLLLALLGRRLATITGVSHGLPGNFAGLLAREPCHATSLIA
jgi:hypothetical protein